MDIEKMKSAVEKDILNRKVADVVLQFFETEFTIRPTDVRVMFDKEMIIIKLVGIFSPSEKQLAMTKEGDELLNRLYRRLFDRTSPILIKMLRRVVRGGIKSLHIEINTREQECFCFVTCGDRIEPRMQSRRKK